MQDYIRSMRLYILRHAEAMDAQPGQRDFDRVLSPHGVEQAARVAEVFRTGHTPCEIVPQVIRSSVAPRAFATASAVASALRLSVVEEHAVSLRADFDAALRLVHELANEFESAMIVGHNPTLSELAYRLCGVGDVRKSECVVVELSGSAAKELARFRG